MPLYLLRMSGEHLSFRLPCLHSVAKLYDFEIRFVSEDLYRAGLVVELDRAEHLELLLDRAVLVLSAMALIAQGDSYDALHQALQCNPTIGHEAGKTWRFTQEAANHHSLKVVQSEVLRSLSYLKIDGKVNAKNPDNEYVIFEDYDYVPTTSTDAEIVHQRDGQFRHVYFGRRIGYSRARPLIVEHDVKARPYYGNTTMEAEMGLLMACQAMPAPGKLIYDPFAGTGSMLYGCAHWGAYVLGSDIDGRQMRGKQRGKGVVPGIVKNGEQYGIADRILDCMTFDVTQNSIRRGGWLDAIITDPPYGVRAGAKRLGKRYPDKRPALEEPRLMPDGKYNHEQPGYLPPNRPYELVSLTLDLVLLARYLLVKGGRLVFFLPTVTEDYDEVDIPVVEGMKEIKFGEGSVQSFGKWGRRLITMEKTADEDGPPPTFEDYEVGEHLPGHHRFNHRYLEGFAPRVHSTVNPP